MKRYICIVSLLVLGLDCMAQTFNPTVVVTNDYEGKTIEVHKKTVAVNVPDSLTKFDLTFDYSVFDNPYKGAYEFVPYMIDMHPDPRPYAGHPFYLRAGAGYTFHPEIDVAFSPKFKNNKLQMGVYDEFRGYYGPYVGLGLNPSASGIGFDAERGEEKLDGYDFRNKAGVRLMYLIDKAVIALDADFRTISASDDIQNRVYNALDFSACMNSGNVDKLDYSARAGLTAGNDRINWPNIWYESEDFSLKELDFNFDADAHYELFAGMRLGAQAGVKYVSTGKTLSNYAFGLYGTPQFLWDFQRYHLKAGLKFAFLVSADNTINTEYKNYSQPSGFLFPDLEFSYRLVDKTLDVYVSATGGNHLNSYSELIEENHFFNASHMKMTSAILDNSVEKFNSALGLRFGSKFVTADVKGGYAIYDSGRLDALYISSVTVPLPYNSFSYLNYDQRFAQADLGVVMDCLDVKLTGRFQDTKVLSKESWCAILPSRFTARGSATFNVRHRLFVGVSADFASARNGYMSYDSKLYLNEVTIPHYTDVGVNASFSFSDMFSVWARVDNLLNNNVQRIIGHAYDGIYFTGGICLNL